jgi:hypothetical protein
MLLQPAVLMQWKDTGGLLATDSKDIEMSDEFMEPCLLERFLLLGTLLNHESEVKYLE